MKNPIFRRWNDMLQFIVLAARNFAEPRHRSTGAFDIHSCAMDRLHMCKLQDEKLDGNNKNAVNPLL